MRTSLPFPTFSPAFLRTLAVLLALFHALLALTATAGKSITADEIAHLTAGVAYTRTGDFRMQPENGNLPQRLAGLPAALAGAPLPAADSAAWRESNVWRYGHVFMYESGLPSGWYLFLGRGMIALASAALGLLVFAWTKRLFGWRGGFLALGLYTFCPAFLAHGALATSDVVMAFFFLAAVGAWARHLETPGPAGAALSTLTLGLAATAKFSAVLLAPMFAAIALAWLVLVVPPGARAAALRRLVRSVAGHVAGAGAVVWACYGFRYSAFAPDLAAGAEFNHPWPALLAGLGPLRPVVETLRDWQALPEAFLYGFTFVVQFAQQRGAFLDGEYSLTGWVRFFPYAFAVKTTPGLLGLLTLGAGLAALAWRRRTAVGAAEPDGSARRRGLWQAAPLAALFGVYWATSLASNLNIGHRHILPTYPVLFIAAGALGRRLGRPWSGAGLAVAGLAAAHAASSLAIRPHYLAYFNILAGGPDNGWRRLVDSSLDWGQDLPGLRRWLENEARGERVFLSYFGTGDPAYEGIRATQLPTLPDSHRPRPWHRLEAGVYAIGATMLQHVYSPVRGPWTDSLETEFQKLRVLEPDLLAYRNDPARRAELAGASEAEWTTAWRRYELLRFARLCHYLRARPADATVGHSIRIYRLSAGEIRGATAGSRADWERLIALAQNR